MGLFRDAPKEKEIHVLASLGDVDIAMQRVDEDELLNTRQRKRLDPASREAYHRSESMTSAGVEKICTKLVSSWFLMDDPRPGVTMDQKKNDSLVEFHNRIELREKLMCMVRSSMIHGNGYFEIIPERGLQDYSQPITPAMGCKDIVLMDSLFIEERIKKIDRLGNFWYLHRTGTLDPIRFHKSRVIQLSWFKTGTELFGHGVYDKGLNTMLAKLQMDWAVGEVIKRHGRPLVVIKTTDGTKDDIKAAFKIIRKLNPKTGFAGTDKHEVQMLNPAPVNPTPFAEFYYHNQAAALEMPFLEFIGVVRGATTGGEVDYQGWHELLESKRNTKITPVINRINNQFLKGQWHEQVYWNPISENKKENSEIDNIRALMVKTLCADGMIITRQQAVQMLRDYGISIPEDDFDLEPLTESAQDQNEGDEEKIPVQQKRKLRSVEEYPQTRRADPSGAGPMRNVDWILCVGCQLRIKVYNDRIPQKCPGCGKVFNRDRENMTTTEYIFALISDDVGSEYGFQACDQYGFVQTDELKPER